MIVEHFGHWSVLETPEILASEGVVDLSKYIGFVYVISFSDGTKYIGAKKIWKRIAKPPNTFKRGPRKGFEQSDWRSYTSSSNVVNERIEDGVLPTEYLIVGFYDSWGKTLYAEALLQIKVNIFERIEGEERVWLNYQIDGTFTASCYDKTIDDNNIAYTSNYIAPNIGLKPKYAIFSNDIVMDIEIDQKLFKSSIITDLMPIEEVNKLITGRIDNYNGIKLPSTISRKDWKYKVDYKYYYTQKELLDDLKITRSDIKNNKNIIKNEIESRAMYMKRLEEHPIEYKIKRRYV